MECPVCKKEFDEYTGRKPKKFCSDECKVKFWNAFKKIQKNRMLEKEIDEQRNPTTEAKVVTMPLTVTECYEDPKISELEKELATIPDKKSGLGKKRAEFIEKEIRKLKQQ